LKIAGRNLLRYRRRTALTATLITVGILAVLLFIAVAGSFKNLMIGQITDSMLGHLEVHRRGYVASIDNLPLNLNLKPEQVRTLEETLGRLKTVEAYSERIKFGAMFSNFTETTNIRLNGVDPEAELRTVPLLRDRLANGPKDAPLLAPGQILIPDLLAQGMKVKVGDTVVIVATNQDGSVNGRTFTVGGVLSGISGPGGRDGYLHIQDAREVLRMAQPEVSEVAIRLRSLEDIPATYRALSAALAGTVGQNGKTEFEVHTWQALSPFVNIANMIDLMTVFIQVLLIAIVLISILNVMVMAVYERVREIGTISAIGTQPGRILGLFLAEGLLLGLLGAALGTLLSLGSIWGLNLARLSFTFGRQDNLVLAPSIGAADVLLVGAVVVLVAVLASLQPAFKASRMDPIKALRHV
jgi:putative ABC transport system permease protein